MATEISKGQMVEWLRQRRSWAEQDYHFDKERGEETNDEESIEMIDAILAALEPKITKGQIEQLSYSFEWKDKDELRERIIPEQLGRVLGLLLDEKCDDCSLKSKAALADRTEGLGKGHPGVADVESVYLDNMKKAILAALEEKGGVSDEEGKDVLDKFLITMMSYMKTRYEDNGIPWSDFDEKRFTEIRSLVLGSQGGAVTRELIYRIAGELSTQDYIPMGLDHPEKIAIFLLEKFREAGVAGKEGKR